MADEKQEKPKMKQEKKPEAKIEEKKEIKQEEKKVEAKQETKKEIKIIKKEEAITKGLNLHASMKQCMYICRFIKNKSIDDAISQLEEVIKLKRIIPFRGEIPHRKGKIMSGRYPVNASKLFIPILKTLKGNVLANKMELDKTIIYYASASYASRPSKRGGGRFKRANVILKAKEANIREGKK